MADSLVGESRFSRQVEVLSILITVLLLLTVATFGLSVWDAGRKREQSLVSNDIQVLSQRIGGLAQQAAFGNQDAFKQLDEARRLLVADLALLNQGGEHDGLELPAASGNEMPILRGIADTLKPIDEQIATDIEAREEPLAAAKERRDHREERPQSTQTDSATHEGRGRPRRSVPCDCLDSATLCRCAQLRSSGRQAAGIHRSTKSSGGTSALLKHQQLPEKTVKGLLEGSPTLE